MSFAPLPNVMAFETVPKVINDPKAINFLLVCLIMTMVLGKNPAIKYNKNKRFELTSPTELHVHLTVLRPILVIEKDEFYFF